jgi:hypothetical protein
MKQDETHLYQPYFRPRTIQDYKLYTNDVASGDLGVSNERHVEPA